jgi:hypothetical protein
MERRVARFPVLLGLASVTAHPPVHDDLVKRDFTAAGPDLASRK